MMEWLNLRRLLLHILVAFICVGSFKTTTTSANNSGNITTSRTLTTTYNNSDSSGSTSNKDNDRNVQYENIVIKLMDNLPKDNCQIFLTNLEKILSKTSQNLYSALNGRNKFGTVIIQLPNRWTSECLPSRSSTYNSSNSRVIGISKGDLSDITIVPKRINKQYIWTQQTKGCGIKGDQIYIDYNFILNNRITEILREWSKYNFGVFDELGYLDDPIYPQCIPTDDDSSTASSDKYYCSNETRSLMMNLKSNEYCGRTSHNSYTPTRQNFICQRRSTWDVIMASMPTEPKMKPFSREDTPITFKYEQNVLTRYMLILDNTQDILVRESWSYLRTAIRKWILDDLAINTEIGIILSSYNNTMSLNAGSNSKSFGSAGAPISNFVEDNKYLDIMSLKQQQNRDTLASFLPYTPNDYNSNNIKMNPNLNNNNDNTVCLECAIFKAISLLQQYELKNGPANTILLIISPGMTYSINVNYIQKLVLENKYKINTINYPHILRQQPLDLLTTTNGIQIPGWKAFTVYENKENAEKTYLTTYFELTDVLQHISYNNYQGDKMNRPIEIHRKIFYDNSNLEDDNNKNNITGEKPRTKTGSFLIDSTLTQPSSFFIYTHNSEQPLLQNIKLISPKGVKYVQRSDSRLALKQLTITSVLNETGSWQYEFERFYGNPQPHYIQVMATPNPINRDNLIESNGRVEPLPNGGYLIIVELVMGGESRKQPILAAQVDVIITHFDKCNNRQQSSNNIGMMIQEVITASTSMLNDKCQLRMSLYDNGNGNSDLIRNDGIYTRYFSPINTKIGVNNTHTTNTGVFRFDFIVTDNGYQAYTSNSVMDDDHDTLMDPNEDLEVPTCCGSNVPIKNKRTVNPFQRYLPPITQFITKEIIEMEYNNSQITEEQYGRIGDLKAQILEGLKVRLAWTSPDIIGKQVARYDIKYALSLNDLIDNYDTAAILWYHGTPFTYQIGDDTTFILNITSEPYLIGQTVYLAIRPYTELSQNAIKGPVSNWVRFTIPKPIITKADTNNHRGVYNDNTDFNQDGDDVTQNKNYNPNSNNSTAIRVLQNFITINTELIIVIVVIILITLLTILIYCYYCLIKNKNRKKLTNKENSNKNENVVVATILNNNNNNSSSDKMNSSLKYDNHHNSFSKKIDDDDMDEEYDYDNTDYPSHHNMHSNMDNDNLHAHNHQQMHNQQQQIHSQHSPMGHPDSYHHLLLPDSQILGLPIYSPHIVMTDENNYPLTLPRKPQPYETNSYGINEENEDYFLMQQHAPVHQMYQQQPQQNDDICSITTTTPMPYNIQSQHYFNNCPPPHSQQQQQHDINQLLAQRNSGKTLSPYQSWTASQLLGEHERRHSPNVFHNINEDMQQQQAQQQQNGYPPIPPLPYTLSGMIDSATPPPQATLLRNHQPLLQPSAAPSANNINMNGGPVENGPYNSSMQGSINSMLSTSIGGTDNNNKKRRNITMV